jgi:Predicted nucleic acid-binding protein, contains PIN domain
VTRTFLDAGVLIAAARGVGIIPVLAHAILDDAERTFVTSDYIRMEVLPKALYHRQSQEVLLYERFFARAVQIVPPSVSLLQQAYTEACTCGLAALDALHIAAAKCSGAEEFITTERPTTPLFRVSGIVIKTIIPPS